MGYEISYFYHERLEEGGYDKDETKVMKRRVGDPFDDLPLEKCAGAVMAQLARRDIWVVDVEIFELSRKKITFRETKGGIVIKNKKFAVGDEGNQNLVVTDLVEEQQQFHGQQAALMQMPMDTPGYQAPASEYQMPMDNSSPYGMVPDTVVNDTGNGSNGVGPRTDFHPHNQGKLRPKRWVSFVPEPQMLAEVKQKQLKFTVEKKYPVFAAMLTPSGVGEIYKTIDDLGRQVNISDKYFVPAQQALVFDDVLRFSETQKDRDGGKLHWGGVVNDDVPDLRR